MRANKIIAFLSGITTLVSLVIAIFFNIYNYEDMFGFVINILLGVFASGLFATVIAIIEYHSCKRRELRNYFLLLCDMRNIFSQYTTRPNNDNRVRRNAYMLKELHEKYFRDMGELIDSMSFFSRKIEIVVKSPYLYIKDFFDQTWVNILFLNRLLENSGYENEYVRDCCKKIDDVIIGWGDYKGKKYETKIQEDKLNEYIIDIGKLVSFKKRKK